MKLRVGKPKIKSFAPKISFKSKGNVGIPKLRVNKGLAGLMPRG